MGSVSNRWQDRARWYKLYRDVIHHYYHCHGKLTAIVPSPRPRRHTREKLIIFVSQIFKLKSLRPNLELMRFSPSFRQFMWVILPRLSLYPGQRDVIVAVCKCFINLLTCRVILLMSRSLPSAVQYLVSEQRSFSRGRLSSFSLASIYDGER